MSGALPYIYPGQLSPLALQFGQAALFSGHGELPSVEPPALQRVVDASGEVKADRDGNGNGAGLGRAMSKNGPAASILGRRFEPGARRLGHRLERMAGLGAIVDSEY